MPNKARAALISRLRMLWSLEALNILFLPALTAFVLASLGERADWPMWLAVAASCVLLAQGALYWKLKLDSVLTGQERFVPRAHLFRSWSRVNPWGLGLVGLVVAVGRTLVPGSPPVVGCTVAFLALAFAEHVNYFHWQLMHDTRADLRRLFRHGIRRSQLWHDLRRAAFPPQGLTLPPRG